MKLKWEVAVYEHKAALLGKSPVEVANAAELLVQALLREHELYQSDYLTVGLDVYNLEAEALGARLAVPGENACPDLDGPLFALGCLPATLALPDIPRAGRFGLMLEAGRKAAAVLAGKANVRVAASGPLTMAAKLAGLEELVMSLCLEDGNAMRLLEFTTELAEGWCRCLRGNHLEVVVFDSMAAPPILSPGMYRAHVQPLHRRLMSQLEESGQAERELVIGGNTTAIAASLAETGANILLCDYAADAAAFKSALGDDTGLQVRRNLNPACLDVGGQHELASEFCAELELFANPIAGTGVLPYDFDPEKLLEFKLAVTT